jgi:hypothetical protein
VRSAPHQHRLRTLRTVTAILANPRYTGRQVWNRSKSYAWSAYGSSGRLRSAWSATHGWHLVEQWQEFGAVVVVAGQGSGQGDAGALGQDVVLRARWTVLGRTRRSCGVLALMGSVADCYDNAMAKSFFATSRPNWSTPVPGRLGMSWRWRCSPTSKVSTTPAVDTAA